MRTTPARRALAARSLDPPNLELRDVTLLP